MQGILANVSAQDFLQSAALRPYALPSASSALIKNNKTWYYKISNGSVRPILESSLDPDKDFDIAIAKRPEIFYGEIIRIMIDKYKLMVENFDKTYGFDIENLPDSNYLLKCIYTLDPESPFIKALPPRTTQTTNLQAELNAELQNAFMNAALSGMTVQTNAGFDFPEIKEDVEKALTTFMAFKTCKIDKARMLKTGKKILRQAVTDPTICSIARVYGLAEIFSDPTTLNAETRQALEYIQSPQTPTIGTQDSHFPPRPSQPPQQ